MLIQTKQAIDALKKAGFKRSEFSARAKRNVFTYNGKQMVEYGLAEIHLKVSLRKSLEMVDAMLREGLSITKFLRKDGSCAHVSVKDDGRGKLSTLKMR